MFRKRLRMVNWTRELEIQYKLKAAGKVIQIGTDIKGRK
jgi:hypothetical protein